MCVFALVYPLCADFITSRFPNYSPPSQSLCPLEIIVSSLPKLHTPVISPLSHRLYALCFLPQFRHTGSLYRAYGHGWTLPDCCDAGPRHKDDATGRCRATVQDVDGIISRVPAWTVAFRLDEVGSAASSFLGLFAQWSSRMRGVGFRIVIR